MKFQVEETSFDGVFEITYDVFEEFRGNIWSTFQQSELFNAGFKCDLGFNHDKFSISNYNVFRGFHGDCKSYKLVTCVYGAITQFVLDWRENSATFGQVLRFEINRDTRKSLLIPPGFGNGYHVTSEQACYHYKLSYPGDYLDSNDQFTVKWHDKNVNFVYHENFKPLVSERDA